MTNTPLSPIKQLQKAIYDRDLALVETLSAGTDWAAVHKQDYHSTEPFEFSMADCYHLTARDANPTEWENFVTQSLQAMTKDGYSLLRDSGRAQIMEENEVFLGLALKAGVLANARTYDGDTIVHLSLMPLPHAQTVQLLVEHGLDLNARNLGGQTVLHQMWEQGPFPVMLANYWVLATQALLAAGANPTLTDGDGVTAKDLIKHHLRQNRLLDSEQRHLVSQSLNQALERLEPVSTPAGRKPGVR